MKFCSELNIEDCFVWENNEVDFYYSTYPCPPEKRIEDIRKHTKKLKAVYRFINGVPEKIWERKELNEVEKAVIALAKAYGCKWIAMDASGYLYAFCGKPYKVERNEEHPHLGGYWLNARIWQQLMTSQQAKKIHFVSWEDEEPYYIGDDENE